MGQRTTADEDAGGKRARILDSAGRLFSLKGYNETAMKDVAEDAGIAVGTIYLYYRNKEDLLSGIYACSSALLLERLGKRLEGHGDPLEKFTIYLEESVAFAFDHPYYFLILFVDMRRKEMELPKRPVFQKFRNYLALGESIVREGQASGEFAGRLPAARLNLVIVSMWVGLVLGRVLEPGFKPVPADRRAVMDVIRSVALEGILTFPRGGPASRDKGRRPTGADHPKGPSR